MPKKEEGREFQRNLQKIKNAYRKEPTDHLISDTVFYTYDEHDAAQLAMAAVLGYTRAVYYLDAARSLMRQIESDLDEISWRMDAYELNYGTVRRDGRRTQASLSMLAEAAKHKSCAQYLSVQREIIWHFYVMSLQHSWFFMENAGKIIDPDFYSTSKEKEYLDLIRAFRNHMEHRDKAVRDISSQDWQSMSREQQQVFELGYRGDQHNNIFFVPSTKSLKGQEQKMPLNQQGFDYFNDLQIAAYERIRTQCLKRLEQHFIAKPSSLPSVEQVGTTLTDSMRPVD